MRRSVFTIGRLEIPSIIPRFQDRRFGGFRQISMGGDDIKDGPLCDDMVGSEPVGPGSVEHHRRGPIDKGRTDGRAREGHTIMMIATTSIRSNVLKLLKTGSCFPRWC